eukprot:285629-Pelagomonas_calceolata.AAC.2
MQFGSGLRQAPDWPGKCNLTRQMQLIGQAHAIRQSKRNWAADLNKCLRSARQIQLIGQTKAIWQRTWASVRLACLTSHLDLSIIDE